MTDFKTILMWTNQNPKHPNSFIIKTDNQKLLGLVRTDKKGQTYWKFKEIKNKSQSENNPVSNPVMDNIQKFQQRQQKAQEKANNHGKANLTEQSIANSSTS